ncbi:diphosphomevalonate decarboxylase, partial [bacterium]|nr:diphosphomevalonate decarboxylase [bacterium]
DGSDAYAEQIADNNYWDIRVLIAITSREVKKIGSTDGMNLSKLTSPYYKSWVESSVHDLNEIRKAIAEKDFSKMGEIAEFSCLKMHALAMASNPGLIYWNPTTLTLIHEVKALREQGYPLFFTIDAGPQVKIVTLPEYASKIESYISQIAGVEKIITTKLGGDAKLIGFNK